MPKSRRLNLPYKKAKSAATMLLVEVTWLDAIADPIPTGDFTHESGPDTFGGVVECKDVGYLVRHDAKEVILAVSRCLSHNDYRHPNSIPTKMVTDITILEPTNDRNAGRAPEQTSEEAIQ